MNSQTIQELEIKVRANVESARKEIKRLLQENQSITNEINKQFQKLNTKALQSELTSAKHSMKELKDVASKLELKGINPSEVLSIKDSFRLLANQITDTIPVLSNMKQSIKDNLDGKYGDSLLMRLRDIGNQAKETANNFLTSFKEKINNVGTYFKALKEVVGTKLAPITNVFKDIGSTASGIFNKIKNDISTSANTTGTPLNKLKKFAQKIKEIGSHGDSVKKKMSSFGSSVGKSFETGIKSIKKFALSLLGIRSAFRAVSKACQAYLSFDDQLNDSIQNSWNVLGSLLAPALEFVASLFSKLVSAVASFVKMLTGIDLVAKANAKAINSQAKATKGLANEQKQLSSIDDIETLSSSSGGGGGATPATITVEDIDMAPFEKFFKKVKSMFEKIFEPFKKAWENVGTGVFESMKSMVESVGGVVETVGSSLFEVWTNGTGQEIIENALLQLQDIFDIIGACADAFSHAWENDGNGTAIIQHIADIFKDIQKFSLAITDSLKKWVISDSFQEALDKIFGFLEDIFSYVQDMCDWLLEMYDKYLKPVIDDKLLPAISSIITAIMDIWNAVKPVIDLCVEYIKKTLEPVIDGLMRFIGGIIDVVKGIADFVSGIFTLNWTRAWEGVKEVFKGIWDTMASLITTPINLLLSGIESMINAIIDGFNWLKKSLNKISFEIPDWVPIVGGNRWGFNLKLSDPVKLPRLAKGDVAYEPTTALIGEYANARTNPEIVSPMSTMKEAFRSVLNEFEFGGTRIEKLVVDVAGENFYQGTVDYINEENARRGVNIIKEM